jgi:actin related protein 2/3 complex subunit 5
MDTSFRKIDIDAYDEDAFLESELFEPDPRSPAQVLSDAKQKQITVRSSLAKWVVLLIVCAALSLTPL